MRFCIFSAVLSATILVNSQTSAFDQIAVPHDPNQYPNFCQSALKKMRWIWRRDFEDLKARLSDPTTQVLQIRQHAPTIQFVGERIQDAVPVFRVVLENGQTAILKLQQIRSTDLSSVIDQNIMQNKAAVFGIAPELLDFLDRGRLDKLTLTNEVKEDWFVGPDFYGYLLQDLGPVWNTKESIVPNEIENWKTRRILKRVSQIRRVLNSLHIEINDYQIVLTPDGVPFSLDFDGAVFNANNRVKNYDPAEERLRTILK
jgi:hypothetical protein